MGLKEGDLFSSHRFMSLWKVGGRWSLNIFKAMVGKLLISKKGKDYCRRMRTEVRLEQL